MNASVAAHADWSVDPRKRWISVAYRNGAAWRLEAPRLVGDLPALFPALLTEAGGGAVALGVDLPLGLPRGFVAAHATAADFPAFLRGLAGRPEFFEVAATEADISPARPFYPARGLRGMTRAAQVAALGLAGPEDLSRWCDRATAERPAGASLFWTLGPNQTGKAAISAWRDLLLPALHGPNPPLLWPFDGDFFDVLHPGRVTIAETYPAEALRHLDLSLHGSKRRQADRAVLAAPLRACMDRLAVSASPRLLAAMDDGFSGDAAGEDRFDSVLGVLCVLNVLAGHRPGGIPPDPWLRRWEGWVLGQTALPR